LLTGTFLVILAAGVVVIVVLLVGVDVVLLPMQSKVENVKINICFCQKHLQQNNT
jgi:hypothetical protein